MDVGSVGSAAAATSQATTATQVNVRALSNAMKTQQEAMAALLASLGLGENLDVSG